MGVLVVGDEDLVATGDLAIETGEVLGMTAGIPEDGRVLVG
jgi:hypothetical protein